MSGFSQSLRGSSDPGWRSHFLAALSELQTLPENHDNWGAHAPLAETIARAKDLAEHVLREDMPIPFVAAGSDGSIEVTWRRSSTRELSCFVEPDASTVLLVRDGKMQECPLERPAQINDYVVSLFE
jgi:hypothetical protein